ncbi:hypothetical protein QZH56_36955 (plasmid) [Streptomyces olivoreticuli]|uniref:hypothetical protein n=1 Tax=Streptomyces olivoreticuli TaxID=68246 RepID=UPI00265A19B7|nr:hypothetical protein [Streptomyces olivoreticuli]WKK27844.1 hypothetical protein QZH56_36955 [Streptomyces olivoreticuli]
MISLLFFTRSSVAERDYSGRAGRNLAVRGETRGHKLRGKWPPTGSLRRPPSHLKEQQARLPARLTELERADADQHRYLTKTAQAHRRTQDKETNKAAGLRAEATLRTGFTPEQMAEEIKERTAAARRAAAEHRAQQQAAREAAERSAAYDVPAHRRDGPSRGGGGLGR